MIAARRPACILTEGARRIGWTPGTAGCRGANGACRVYAKRVIATTVFGVLAGILCWQGGESAGVSYTPALIAATILNRGFIGFVIGISALRLHYLAHGAMLGVLGSLPMAVFAAAEPNAAMVLTGYGALWGLLIEVITTRVLKAPMT